MKMILGARQSGRTTELLEMAHETKRIIVTTNRETAKFLYKESIEKGYIIEKPISYWQLFEGREIAHQTESKDRPQFLFDNFDEYLQKTLGWDVEAIVMCTDLMMKNHKPSLFDGVKE